MNKYIAAFYSHFGALSYYKALKQQGVTVKLMPVPRQVSSSCGTCAAYEHGEAIEVDGCELEAIYLVADDALACVVKK